MTLAKWGRQAGSRLNSSMMKLALKSAAIGFLSAKTLVACVAASSTSSNETGRYVPITWGGSNGFVNVLDTRTGIRYQSPFNADPTPAAKMHTAESGGR